MRSFGHETKARNARAAALLRVQALVPAGSIGGQNAEDMQ
jgi:hypothetical protein